MDLGRPCIGRSLPAAVLGQYVQCQRLVGGSDFRQFRRRNVHVGRTQTRGLAPALIEKLVRVFGEIVQ